MIPNRRALPLDSASAAMFGLVAWATLVAVGGRIEVPFVPVPLTLQTLAAMGAGLALGPRRGALAVGLTVLAGACGLPAFSGGGAGIAHLVGPTGGYLLALPLLAAGYGLAARRLWAAPVASLGHLILGTAWLALFVGAGRAVVVGLAPFVLGEAVKGALALAGTRALMTSPRGRGEDLGERWSAIVRHRSAIVGDRERSSARDEAPVRQHRVVDR